METTTQSLARKEFKGIDVTKFILALLVVAGHTHPFKDINNPTFIYIWKQLLLLVVPYFFMAAGFFLFQKVERQPNKAQKLAVIWPYIKRIAKMYIYWTIIFIPITLWNYATDDIIFHKDIILFIRGTLFFGENYYSWPLWFLLSMTYSLAFIYLLTLLDFNRNSIFLISILFFAVATIFNELVKQESNSEVLLAIGRAVKYLFLTGRLFTGMFYLMIGGLIANNKFRLPPLAIVALIAIAIYFQYHQVKIVSPLFFGLFPIALFLLTFNLNLRHISNNAFYRKCSTVLYFTHMIVFFIYSLLFRTLGYFGWDAFLVSIVIPILLTPLINKYENRWTFLKELFG
jgi:hypothetical protein